MSEIDQIIDGIGRISLLAQLRDKVVEAYRAASPRCGSCSQWMKKSSCPKEGGFGKGPSSDHPACPAFSMSPSAEQLKKERTASAVEFAKRHGLPVPADLRLTTADMPVRHLITGGR